MRELGRPPNTYARWGMRIVFVPEDEIDMPPRIEVREPEDEAGPSERNGRPADR